MPPPPPPSTPPQAVYVASSKYAISPTGSITRRQVGAEYPFAEGAFVGNLIGSE